MSGLVSFVLTKADKLPIVGAPINQATTWYYSKKESENAMEPLPPPPYESSALEKEKVADGVSLIQMATELYPQQQALHLYLMGIDKLLTALPVDTDPLVKSSLEAKLIEFKQKANLILSDPLEKASLSPTEQQQALGGLAQLIIQAAVLSAVTLKKSPIPSMVHQILCWSKAGWIKIDQACCLQERATRIAHLGLEKAIEMDQHYKAHQWVAEVFYTGCTAILKAGVAYAETEK
ncbi:hypothetical protein A0J61_03753 [Choanephora cucurbitarum]|uniref:Uncharacterized protein n=1 Tax=Choanephora cucurbitarum TaxID=101091 RepID=A0A1C7NGP2_9FUNG|nr:hypothetical protein A0J61_03753 [Choanephora cucurbitarum]